MKIRIKNASNIDFKQFLPLLKSFLPFAMNKMGFDRSPSIVLASDIENSRLPLGKTAHYEPEIAKITIFTDKRHPKDILRSLSHELVHHKQNCGGQFKDFSAAGEGYAQEDTHLRGLEEEAYSLGNMTFRDWEDTHKKQLQESTYYNQPNLAGDTKMNTKQWKDLEINNLLMERWGYKTPQNEISHLCAMLVTEKATGKVGHPINHTLLESGDVTHYDVEFDDIIVEGMPVGALDVEVQEEHMHGRREDYPHDESKPREQYMEEGEDFPDLTGDGKVTQADVLKGRGVKLNEDGVTVHSFAKGDNVSSVLNKYGIPAGMEQKVVDYHNFRAKNDDSLKAIGNMNKIAVGGNLMIPGEQAMKSIEAGDYNKSKETTMKEQDMSMDLPNPDMDLQTAINTNVDTSPPSDMEVKSQIDADIKTATMSENQLRTAIREALNKAFNG